MRSWSTACLPARSTASIGMHWMDIAGYADSDGYTARDDVRPYAYKYRDYLVRSINADRPWDRLIREQLAGDEMVKPPYANLSPTDIDRLVATGFLRTAPDGTADGSVDATTAQNDVIAETVKIVSTTLLGLTVGCAQCHNHRYDPISPGGLLPLPRTVRAGVRPIELAAACGPSHLAVD